ncbi:MAG: hypothetical protein ACYS5V_02005 [Planctomycetota bacterium]|jgi:hypothetical protein
MTIQLKCPQCGSALHARDEQAGKSGRCPACKQLFRIPEPKARPAEAGVAGPFALDDLHALADGEVADEPTAARVTPWPSAGQGAAAEEYDLKPEVLSPVAAPPVAPPPARSTSPGGQAGAMSLGCLGAIGFALRNLGPIFLLAIMFWLIVLAFYLLAPDPDDGLLSPLVGLAMSVCVLIIYLTLGGYYLTYLCDVADGTIDGNDGAQALPEWDFAKQIVLALRWIGMYIVYVLPGIAFPLLPLGCLALSATRDGRAVNLGWALKAFAKAPGRFFALWAMLLLWVILCTCIFVVGMNSYGDFARWVLKDVESEMMLKTYAYMLIGGLLLLVTAFIIFCQVIVFRCIGLLGRYGKDILAKLPRKPNAGVTALYVFGALAVSVAIWVVIFITLAAAAAGALWAGERSGRPDPPRPTRTYSRPPPASDIRDRTAEARQGLEKVAAKYLEYRRRQGKPPSSLAELAAAGGLTDRDLRSPGDPARQYVLVSDLPAAPTTPAAIVLYDPSRYLGGTVVYGVDERGRVVTMRASVLQRKLRDQARLARRTARPTPPSPSPGPEPTPYSRPPRKLVVRRVPVPPLDTPAWARGSRNIRNLLSDLCRYANAHQGKFPASLEALQQAGHVPDVEDLRSPGDYKRSYVYIPGQDAAGPAGNILAYDPVEYRLGTRSVLVYVVTVGGRVLTLTSMAELRRRLAAQTPSGPELTMQLPPPKVHVPRRSLVRRRVSLRGPAWSQTPDNLRNLYGDLYRYADGHGGRFPPSLAALRDGGYVKDLTDLRCLSEPMRSYVYIAGQEITSDPDAILAYDPVGHVIDRNRTVAYAITVGGRVRTFKSVAEIKRKLAPQAHLGPGVSMRLPDPSQPPKPKPKPPDRDRPARPPPPPPVVKRPGPADPAGEVTWDVPYWPKIDLPDDHPFLKVCHALRQVRAQGATGAAGVGFGPPAKDKADDAYVRFRDKALEHLDANGGKAPRSVRREGPHRIDGVEYDRITVTRDLKMFALYTGIAEGRCVSYWYFGARTPFLKFTTGVGKARFKPSK